MRLGKDKVVKKCLFVAPKRQFFPSWLGLFRHGSKTVDLSELSIRFL
jgi:hypothetical protein